MAIDKEHVVQGLGIKVLKVEEKPICKEERTIEQIMVSFIENHKGVPKNRFVIARNQIYSLYKRMEYHPDKKLLIEKYESDIKKIIKFERGYV